MILGAHNISKRIEPGRNNVAVKTIKVHDKWNPSTVEFEGDLAMLKLSNPVTFTEFIKPVCIADRQTSTITNGVVIGWGVSDDTNIPSNIPRKIVIPILQNLDCLKKNRGLLSIISNDLFCAGKTGSGVCMGDSGSGYYVEVDGQFYVRGIVSSSTNEMCSRSSTALYSDVLKNLNFIKGISKASKTTTAEPVLKHGGEHNTSLSRSTMKPFIFYFQCKLLGRRLELNQEFLAIRPLQDIIMTKIEFSREGKLS